MAAFQAVCRGFKSHRPLAGVDIQVGINVPKLTTCDSQKLDVERMSSLE